MRSVGPVGAEFRVNSSVTAAQLEVAVTMDDAGDAVVVWAGHQSGNYDIYAQRYNAAGVPQGAEFRVNVTTTNDQRHPSVAMDSSGNFVITWSTFAQDTANSWAVYGRRYSNAGVAQGGEFRVNNTTTNNQLKPSVAMDAAGDFVVAWESKQNSTSYEIYARRYSTSGTAQGSEFVVDSDPLATLHDKRDAAAAMDNSGNFVVTWSTLGQDVASSWEIYARRYSSAGAAQGSEFRVNTNTSSDQIGSAVAMDDNGNFVVTWTSKEAGTYDIYAQRYDNAGGVLGSAILVNNTTADAQSESSVAMSSTGNFLVAWTSNLQDGSGKGVYGRRYLAASGFDGNEFLVNTTTSLDQKAAAAAMSSAGDFVACWDGNGPGDSAGVFAQLYRRDVVPDGSETRVNTFTTNAQRVSAVASDDAGDFVVVWQSAGEDDPAEYDYGIYAQRFNAAGVSQGSEFRVHTTTSNEQIQPSVAMDASGDFVVVWASFGQDAADGWGVFGQRFNAAGVAQGSEFQVNATTAGDQMFPWVAMTATGNFVISWASLGTSVTDAWNVYARRYSSAGVAQGGEFRVNTSTADNQNLPMVAMDATGDFVITWSDLSAATGDTYDVYAQRYNAVGVAQGSNFRVNTTTSGNQLGSSVAMDYDGDFVIVWTTVGQPTGDSYGIYAQLYAADGTARGGEFRANTTTADQQTAATVAMDDDGDFVVTWMSLGQDGSRYGIYAQRFRATGATQGAELRINATTDDDQVLPTVAMDAYGDFVVTWSSNNQDGSDYGIYAQRFTVASAVSFPVRVGGSLQDVPGFGLDAAQQAVASSLGATVASLDTGVDYTHPALYQNIWLNVNEIPAAVRAQLRDLDGDGRITFRDLNRAFERGLGWINDRNGNGFIDGWDVLQPVSRGGWADGLDGDGNGYVDDLIGWDFVNNDNDPFDDNGHGSHGAGLIVQVSPSADILPLKFLDSDGAGLLPQAIAALEYALNQGVHISAGSWVPASFSQQWSDALQHAQALGHLFIAAAGNGNTNALSSLAGVHRDNVVVVAASNADGTLASFSNADPAVVDLAAPGVGLVSSVPGGGYAARSGTSVSVSVVAGAVSLLWGADPSLHYREVLDALFGGADHTPALLAGTAHGGLDILGALSAAGIQTLPADDAEQGAASSGDRSGARLIVLPTAAVRAAELPRGTGRDAERPMDCVRSLRPAAAAASAADDALESWAMPSTSFAPPTHERQAFEDELSTPLTSDLFADLALASL